MKTIGAKQQHRSKRAATELFDNQTQDIEDLLERNAGGDHLEKALFTREQRLTSLALRNFLFQLLVGIHELAGSSRDPLIEFLCDPLLLTQEPCLLQSDRCL